MSDWQLSTVNAETADVSAARIVAALSEPALYPDQPTAVEHIQTHFAWVFLTGQYAYKLKKPVMIRGADLRSVHARELACREELRLNLRLASETYICVLPLLMTAGGFALAGNGTPADWLIKMHQLPRSSMLDHRLRQNRLHSADITSVLQVLVDFYRRTPPEPIAAEAALEQLVFRIDEAFSELKRPEFALPAERIAVAETRVRNALAQGRQTLLARFRSGLIRELHGDLRAEHICLGPPVQIIDAMEFSRALRLLDPAEELAMLAVDLERHGGAWAAPEIISTYRRLAGDPVPAWLWRFYCAVRAVTRAKVAIWHLEIPSDYPDPAPWRRTATDLLDRTAHWLDSVGTTTPV